MAKGDEWAIVELFGHQTIAGRISEYAIGGCSFVRIDVPELGENRPAYSKLFGNGAIYAITPCDEETARAAARSYSPQPLDTFSARRMLGLGPAQEGLFGGDPEDEEEADDDEEDMPL